MWTYVQAHCHIFCRSWLTDALLAGNIHVNIHTAANPSGEIRAQVRAVPGGGNQPPLADISVDPGLNVAPSTMVTLDAGGSPDPDAGPDRNVDTGSLVMPDGSGSFDPDAGPLQLSYSCSLDTVPAGSAATLASADTTSPTFTADLEGEYTATLVVNDGKDDSTPDSVNITAAAPSGGFEAGRAKYDADCAGCLAAGTCDPSGFAGDIAGTDNLLVNDLGTLNPGMNGVLLTDQEILDLRAFLDDPSIQPWQAFEKSHLRHAWVNVDTETAGKEVIQQTGRMMNAGGGSADQTSSVNSGSSSM